MATLNRRVFFCAVLFSLHTFVFLIFLTIKADSNDISKAQSTYHRNIFQSTFVSENIFASRENVKSQKTCYKSNQIKRKYIGNEKPRSPHSALKTAIRSCMKLDCYTGMHQIAGWITG